MLAYTALVAPYITDIMETEALHATLKSQTGATTACIPIWTSVAEVIRDTMYTKKEYATETLKPHVFRGLAEFLCGAVCVKYRCWHPA